MTVYDAWEQVSGDVNASVYGATFAQVDGKYSGGAYGVRVVEIVNGYDACGRDWSGDAYLTSSSYVDVDNMEWRKARSILESHGWLTRQQTDECDMPYSLAKRLVYARRRNRDLQRLARWERRELNGLEWGELETLRRECDTLRAWFSLPRTVRAESAASYGGYSDGQSLTFATLRDAMEYHGIPRSALWQPSEYDAPAPEID